MNFFFQQQQKNLVILHRYAVLWWQCQQKHFKFQRIDSCDFFFLYITLFFALSILSCVRLSPFCTNTNGYRAIHGCYFLNLLETLPWAIIFQSHNSRNEQRHFIQLRYFTVFLTMYEKSKHIKLFTRTIIRILAGWTAFFLFLSLSF